jgi:hypothetical protein
MKRALKKWMMLVLMIALGGCAATQQIKIKSHSERTDIFREVREEGEIPNGCADLIIQASLKTHLEGFYMFELEESFHGKPRFPFLINVDGQAILWEINGQREIAPYYDEKGRKNPEGGDGMRYVLKKRIRLSSGSHKVFFSLPSEGYLKQIQITLNDGCLYKVEFKPIYRRVKSNIQSFLSGINRFEVVFDGQNP